jgi:hypothetical protein
MLMAEQWFEHFIEINDEWGHIGNIYWRNSTTTPHKSMFNLRWVIYWGCFIPHLPKPNIMYGKEVVVSEDPWEF